MNQITLTEYQTCSLARSDFLESDAERIYREYRDKINIDWPTPKTNYCWQLTSLGWVGYIPLGQNNGITLKPKSPIINLFKMLEYAYDLKSFKLLEGLYDIESIRDFYERLATILAEKVMTRVRQGLYRKYIEEHLARSFIRGKMDMTALCRTPVKSKIFCFSENHTIDISDNQIITWTLFIIARSYLLSREQSLRLIYKADRMLRNSISLKYFNGLDCINRNYNRLNADYEVLHKLCRFFLENTAPTLNTGDRSMIPFLVDMSRLFELFVARWLKDNINPKFDLRIQESRNICQQNNLRIQMDILITDRESGRPLCVVDTKYKVDNTVANIDYYQVIAYSDAVGCRNAVLIYPGELTTPFDAKPGGIRVRTATFDLGKDLDVAGKNLLQHLYEILEDAN